MLAAAPAALPTWVSLGAGMLGGSIGVGVAYPLDTLKVKVQAYAGGDASAEELGSLGVARAIVQEEGVSGFYNGVSSTMAGQALIKGVVFFVYEWAKAALAPTSTGVLALLAAACISGAAGSLVVTPIERVKVVMQAADATAFASPLACVGKLVEEDGLGGVLFRGLGATLAREIPACTLAP